MAASIGWSLATPLAEQGTGRTRRAVGGAQIRGMVHRGAFQALPNMVEMQGGCARDAHEPVGAFSLERGDGKRCSGRKQHSLTAAHRSRRPDDSPMLARSGVFIIPRRPAVNQGQPGEQEFY